MKKSLKEIIITEISDREPNLGIKVLKQRTSRQKEYKEDDFATGVIAYANELFFHFNKELRQYKRRDDLILVLNQLVDAYNNHVFFGDFAEDDPLTKDIAKYINLTQKQTGNSSILREEIREFVNTVFERYFSNKGTIPDFPKKIIVNVSDEKVDIPYDTPISQSYVLQK
jgi:hypothetical protein